MPIRHDLRCSKCDKLYSNIVFSPSYLNEGVVVFHLNDLVCKCGSNIFKITWESGEAPIGRLKGEYIDDLWKNIDTGSTEYKKRAAEEIKRKKK